MSKSKQLLVRTALVTGSTVAALIGAQTLALIDQHPVVSTVQQVDTAQTVVTNLKTTTITHAAPTIVVLSRSNQPTSNSAAAANSAIVPPVPQVNQTGTVIIQSNPLTVQQFAPVTTSSSR